MAVQKTVVEGDVAPGFKLRLSDDHFLTMDDYPGQWIVLYFYPKDNTPTCTRQAIEFSEQLPEFAKLNAHVVGVSPDSCTAHDKFSRKYDLTVTLLSDPENLTASVYNVWDKKTLFGHKYMGIVRSTFVIDPQRRIRAVWRNVRIKGHIEGVLDRLKELQAG